MKDQEKSNQKSVNEIKHLQGKVLGPEDRAEIDKKLRLDIGISSFDEIIDNIQETVILTNKQLEAVYTSPSCKRVTGHDLSHHQGKTVLDFVHPDDLDYVIRNVVETEKEKAGRKIEYRYQHADGHYIWVETSGSPLLDDNGEIKGAVFVGRDISDRKKMEETLLESEEKYRAIFENTGTATLFVEEDFSISLANKEFELLSGFSKADIEGKTKITEIFSGEQLKKIKRFHRIRRLDSKKVPKKYETQFTDRKGNIRGVLATVDIIPGTKTSIVSLLDITELKQAQEKLYLADEVFENSSAGIMVTSPARIIQRVNPAFTDITGFSEAEAVGRDSKSLIRGKDIDQYCKDVCEALSKGPRIKIKSWNMRKNGDLYLEGATITAIRDNEGKMVQLVKTFNDITEEVKLREERHQIKEQTELAIQMAAIITFLPDPTFVIDVEGKVIAWNKAIEELTGITAENVLGKGDYEYSRYFYGNRRPLLADLVLNYEESHSSLYSKIRWENKCLIAEDEITNFKGEIVCVWGKATPLYNSKNEIVGAIESIRDITNIRTTERSLEESNEKYSKLIHYSSDAILILDAESETILEANEAAKKITGLSSAELIGKHFTSLHPTQDTERYLELFRQAIKAKEDIIGINEELYLLNKDSLKIPVEINANIIEIGGRSIVQVIMRDITDRKRKEKEMIKWEIAQATEQAQQKIVHLKKVVAQQIGLAEIGFYSEGMNQIYQMSQKYYLDRSIPVLIQGETGTGKEIIAKLIHYGDMDEIERPFVDINCAAISPNLFESELFGYEAGAFTNSLAKGQRGKFDIADGGTLFLDEISELPLELQGKLLRVIQEKQFYRVGGIKKIKADVRIICATNKDLEKAVKAEKFRDDLYYRLRVGYIHVPPLKERKEDILPLAEMFLHELSKQKGKHFEAIEPEAAEMLMSYPWPGNVRELRNVIELAVFMHNDTDLRPAHLEFAPPYKSDRLYEETLKNSVTADSDKPFKNLMDELSFRILEQNKGNITKTARALGISRNTLYKKIREYNW